MAGSFGKVYQAFTSELGFLERILVVLLGWASICTCFYFKTFTGLDFFKKIFGNFFNYFLEKIQRFLF
jgi:hypothetical protein